MELEKQITTLELSLKLRELGVKQKSMFYWTLIEGKYQTTFYLGEPTEEMLKTMISALTVAELGELLPDWNDMLYFPKKLKGEWGGIVDTFNVITADNEADCRAKMLVCLIEKKLIKI